MNSPHPRGDAVLQCVIACASGREVGVEDIRGAVQDAGHRPSKTQVFNTIGYLIRKGTLKRVRRGRYWGVSAPPT